MPVSFTITAGAWGGGGYGMGYIDDAVDVNQGGSISPDPSFVDGHRVRRVSQIEQGAAFGVTLEYAPGPGEWPPDAVFSSIRVVGEGVDETYVPSPSEYWAIGYNGQYSAWNWNVPPGFQNGAEYEVTFTLTGEDEGGGGDPGGDGMEFSEWDGDAWATLEAVEWDGEAFVPLTVTEQ